MDGEHLKIVNNPSDPMAAAMMAMTRGNGDGLFGGGGGGGLIGGLILGSILRNGNGGFFGGGGDGGGATVAMSTMQALGDIKAAVALSTAQMETSQALQSSTIQAQLSGVAAALTNTVAGVKEAVNAGAVLNMQTTMNDGEKTRALITQQYEQSLSRQLSDANAQIIELRSDANNTTRARQVEVNVTQNVQQMQQQQQMANMMTTLLDVVQSIRATNQAINIGAGTLTASPTNTNTNTRVN